MIELCGILTTILLTSWDFASCGLFIVNRREIHRIESRIKHLEDMSNIVPRIKVLEMKVGLDEDLDLDQDSQHKITDNQDEDDSKPVLTEVSH